MTQKTLLNDTHRALGAKMVDFGGWDMPIHYGSQIEEHHQVRRDAGMFDVSHMTVVDLRGPRTREFLRQLVANSVDKLQKPGKALYTTMLNEEGGVIDDLIIYFMDDAFFRLVVNAATRGEGPGVDRCPCRGVRGGGQRASRLRHDRRAGSCCANACTACCAKRTG